MKLAETMLCWKPNSEDCTVCKWPDLTDASNGYMTTGACWSHFKDLTPTEQLCNFLIEAIQIAIRDKVPIEIVHRALLVVDEYRSVFAHDVPLYRVKP